MKKKIILAGLAVLGFAFYGSAVDLSRIDEKIKEIRLSPYNPRYYMPAPAVIVSNFGKTYICNICGNSTFWRGARFLPPANLPELIDKMKKNYFDISTDEREFCDTCSPRRGMVELNRALNRPFEAITNSEVQLKSNLNTEMKLNLPKSTRVIVVGGEEDVEIEVPSLKIYISADLIKDGVLQKNANLRSGPGIRFESFGSLLAGRKIEVIPNGSKDRKWVQIKQPEQLKFSTHELKLNNLNGTLINSASITPQGYWIINLHGQSRRIRMQNDDINLLKMMVLDDETVRLQLENPATFLQRSELFFSKLPGIFHRQIMYNPAEKQKFSAVEQGKSYQSLQELFVDLEYDYVTIAASADTNDAEIYEIIGDYRNNVIVLRKNALPNNKDEWFAP